MTETAEGVARALGLEGAPFGTGSQDVHLATPSLVRRETMIEKLLLGSARLIAIVDATGTGKTTMLRRVIGRLAGRAHTVHLPLGPIYGPEAVLRRLATILDVPLDEQCARRLGALRHGLAVPVEPLARSLRRVTFLRVAFIVEPRRRRKARCELTASLATAMLDLGTEAKPGGVIEIRVLVLVAVGVVLLVANVVFVRAVIHTAFGANAPSSIAPFQVIGAQTVDERLGTAMAHLLRARLSRIREEMESSQRSLAGTSLTTAPDAVGPANQRATLVAIPDKVFEPLDVDLSVAGVEVGGVLSWLHRLLAQDRMMRLVVDLQGERAVVVGNVDAFGGSPLYLETATETDAIVTDIAYTIMQREMSHRIPEVGALELVEFRTLVSTLHDVANLNRRTALGRVTVGGYAEPLDRLAELTVKTPGWRSLVHLTAQVAENAQAPEQALRYYEMELEVLSGDDPQRSEIQARIQRLAKTVRASTPEGPAAAQAEDHDAAVDRLRRTDQGQRILSLLGVEAGGGAGAPRVAILGGLPGARLLQSDRAETVGGQPPGERPRRHFEAGYVDSLAQAVQLVAPDARFVFAPMEGTTDYYTQSELVNAWQALVGADPDVLLVTFGPLVGTAFEALASTSIKRGIQVVITTAPGHPAMQTAAPLPPLYRSFDDIMVVSALGLDGKALESRSVNGVPGNILWAPGENVPVLPMDGERIESRSGTSYAAALAAGVVGSLLHSTPEASPKTRVEALRDSARPTTVDGLPVIRLAAARERAAGGSAVADGPMVRESRLVSLAIPDNDPGGIESSIEIAASGTLKRILVNVSATHTYIGDLRIVLISPTGVEVTLQDRSGGSGNDLVATYGSDVDSSLRGLIGGPVQGSWRLRMSDHSRLDVGTFNSWALEIEYEG
jgi:subtilisin-like proprotein convertase family protein